MNKVILVGHLGADPRFNKTTTNQKSVVNFRMATNTAWTDAQGQKQEKAEWHNVVAWNRLAETCGQYLHKGSQVLVEGRNETRSYNVVVEKQCTDDAGNVLTNPQTNQPYTVKVVETRYVTEVVASRVKFLDKAPSAQAQPVAGTVATPGTVVASAAVNPAATVDVPPVAGAAAPATVAAAPVAPAETQVQPVVVPGV